MKGYYIKLLLVFCLLLFHINICKASVKENFILGSGDILNIQVFDNPDLSSPKDWKTNPYVVRPDGFFSMPLIGDINVNNKTIFEVTKEIVVKLREYLKHPMVTINVVNPGSTRVYVLGEVEKQGLYELKKRHNLVDVVSMAKGVTPFSNKKNIFVIRNGESDVLLKVNLNELIKGNGTISNIQINEGDCVYLSSNNKIDFERDIYPFFIGGFYISEAITNDSKENNYTKNNIGSGESGSL